MRFIPPFLMTVALRTRSNCCAQRSMYRSLNHSVIVETRSHFVRLKEGEGGEGGRGNTFLPRRIGVS